MWPFGSMYTRPSPCIRKACSTRSLYSAGVSSPIMSVRPRISVLRLRQLSIGRLYDRVEEVRNLDLPRLRQERREAPPRGGELAAGALGLTVLPPPAGRGEVAQSRHELIVAEPRRLVERRRRLTVLGPQEVSLRAPEDALEPRSRRRPLVGTRVVLHAVDRA